MTVMKKKIKMSIGIGGPTIVMIFVIVSLTTLGTLSLVTANSDLILTEKTYQSSVDYYTADSKSEEFLAKASSVISSNAPSSASVSTSIPINERQSLQVQLLPSYSPKINSAYYKIRTWKVVNNEYWNYEDYQIPFEDQIPANN